MSELIPFPADRSAVVTGAASARGIGRATADRLASQGWCVAIVDINAEAAESGGERDRGQTRGHGKRHGCGCFGPGFCGQGNSERSNTTDGEEGHRGLRAGDRYLLTAEPNFKGAVADGQDLGR